MARILIVDDEEMDRILIAEVLRTAGHDPVFAPDGLQALQVFRNSSVDLVVTDIVMPELDGLTLLENLMEEESSAPVIAMSGVTAKDLNAAARKGAYAVLTKPVDPEELLKEISRALAGAPPYQDFLD